MPMLIPSLFKSIIKIGAFLPLTTERSPSILYLSMASIAQDNSNKTHKLQVEKISPKATLPTRASLLSAGYDLSSAEETTIPAGCRGIVKTDLRIACPEGTYGRIAPRSGLAVKYFIDVGAGVVDADYRGNVGVVLFNFGEKDFKVEIGDRIAQLILEKICMVEVDEVDGLDDTSRGEGGFGSSGKN